MLMKEVLGDGNGDPRFRTTHWSVVLVAGDQQHSGMQEALEQLCQAYWLPVYIYIRRQVRDVNEAQDLTQEFFARMLEKRFLDHADRKRGRFRSFLLVAVRRFLSKERVKANALKRGGGRRILSLDFALGDRQCRGEPLDERTAEQEFERQYALQVFEIAHERLRREYVQHGKEELFEQLKPLMAKSEDAPACRTLAESLGMSEGAVKTAVYRMRQRFREILRAEISQTVSSSEEVDDELRQLMVSLA
jgi:RNA polymerase sigma-70 factor (ECF subfamily)